MLHSAIMARIGTLIRREISQIAVAAQRPLAKRVSRLAKLNRELRHVVLRQQTLIQSLKDGRRSAAVGRGKGGASSMTAAEIRDLRKRRGLSRARFAELAGVSAGAIYLWESGRSAPRRSSIERLRAVGGRGKAAPANGRKRRWRRAKATPANGRKPRGQRTEAAATRRPLTGQRAGGRKKGATRA